MSEEEKSGFFPGSNNGRVVYAVDKEYPSINHLNSYLAKVCIEISGIRYGLIAYRTENIKEVMDAEVYLFDYTENRKEELIRRIDFESKLPFRKYDFTPFYQYPDFPKECYWRRGVSFLARKILDYEKREDSDIYVLTPPKDKGEIFKKMCWWAIFSDIREECVKNPNCLEEKVPGDPKEKYINISYYKADSIVYAGYDTLALYLFEKIWKNPEIKNLLDIKNIPETIKPDDSRSDLFKRNF